MPQAALGQSAMLSQLFHGARRFHGHLQMVEVQWELEDLGSGQSSERELPDIGLGPIRTLFLCLPFSWLLVLTSLPGPQSPFQPCCSLPVSEKKINLG